MKTRPEIHGVAVLARLRRMLSSGALTAGAMLALALPSVAQTATTVYFDNFNDQQNINSDGPYTQTLAGSAPTTRSSTYGGSASAVWGSGAEFGGWGQRCYGNNGVATPTSSNSLPFTPDANRIYKLQMTVDTTPLGGGGGGSWFAAGFTSYQHNWDGGVDGGTIDTANLVRFNSNTVATITYTRSGADLVDAGITRVGWVTDLPGYVNMNSSTQVKIDNFTLTAGVANPTVTYNGNGSDGGAVPTDGSSPYAYGNTVTVLNDGTMTRSGYSFQGWNTAADGTGTNYSPAATFTVEDNTTLYAKWQAVGSYTVTYDGNSNTSGAAPVDASSPYLDGSTVTVLGNTGSLSRTSFTFSGWNTAADGSGTSYSAASTFTINANTTLYAQWQPDFVWDNGAGTGNWNTTDANWTGATWSNSAISKAVFNNASGTVTLTEAITGGGLGFYNGGAPSGSHELIVTGSDLSVASVTSWGGYYAPLGNGGVDSIPQAYGQRLTFNGINLNVSGDAVARRGMLYLLNANLNVGGQIKNADAWSVFRADNSTVSAPNGIDLSGQANQVELSGGTITTPFVKVGNAAFAGQGGLALGSGVKLVPTGASADYLAVYNNGDVNSRGAAGLASGGMEIDTAYDVTVATSLVGAGSLTKSGSGTLTLNQSNSYTGGTNVNEGTLVLASGAWTLSTNGGGGGGAVTVGNGATLTADNTVAIKLAGLTLNGGTVNAINSTANGDWGNFFLTGNVTATGSSNLGGDIALRMSTVNFDVASGGTLTVGGLMHGGVNFTNAGISKTGDGTLALTAANTYTGNTTVDAGTLSLGNGTSNSNLSDVATVSIAFGATVNLNFTGSDTVGKLIIDGETMPGGTYNATTHPDYFTGTGSVFVPDQDGIWTSTTSGNWSVAANWQSNTIATGADKTATFSAGTGSESITVTLDTAGRKIGNLAFSNATYTLAGVNTLTFDSTTTPLISVASGLTATISAKLASAFDLSKSGAGTLRLSAQNNFSGAITVSEGVLELATDWTLGNVGTGTPIVPGLVTVESGATLRADNTVANQLNGLTLNGGTVEAVGVGNGDWGNFHLTGNVTATGTSNLNADVALRAANVDFFVDSGATLNVGGVMHNGAYYGIYYGAPANISKTGSGTLTLAGLNTFTGNTSIDEGALNVSSSGSLRFRPSTNGATNSVSAGSSSATLSFLGTVSIDLSAADTTIGNSWPLINLASFTGTQTLTPTAVTSSLGAFTEVTPGTWELPVTGAKWVFTEVDGNLAYVNAATPYETWGNAYGLAAGSESGDLDNDGLTNFQEFAFGLIPNSGSSVNPITSQLDKTTGQFSYQRLNGSGLTYTIWTSTDLVNWTEDTTAVQNVTTGSPNDTVQVTLSGVPLTASKLFVRVKAE